MNDKEKIELFAREKFLSSGFYKITMDEIAAGLRVSKKTIYKYFPSKDSLLESVINSFTNNTRKILLSNIAKQPNAILKIKTITEKFAELSLKINEKLLFDLQTHRPDLWESVEKFRGKLLTNIWEEIIDQGKREGYIVDKPNVIIVTIIYSSVRSIINPTFLLNNDYSVNQAFNITFDLLINSILTPEGREVYNKSSQDKKNGEIK